MYHCIVRYLKIAARLLVTLKTEIWQCLVAYCMHIKNALKKYFLSFIFQDESG